jgi:hypothetical protein
MKINILLEKFVDSALLDFGMDEPETNDPADAQELSYFQGSDQNDNEVDEGELGNQIRKVADYIGTDYTNLNRTKEEILSGNKDTIIKALKDGVVPSDVAFYISHLTPGVFREFVNQEPGEEFHSTRD